MSYTGTFKDFLAYQMGRQVLSQADIAHRTGLARGTISQILNGQTPLPKQSTIRRIVTVGLGILIEDYSSTEPIPGVHPPSASVADNTETNVVGENNTQGRIQ